LIACAYHTAGQAGGQTKEPCYVGVDLEKVNDKNPATLLKLTEEAIRAKDQKRSCALAHLYGTQGHNPRDLFSLLLGFAVNNDGALHAEKYFHTVNEEFTSLRPAFRWQHLAALARVSASLAGNAAPGVEEARKLLA
ncbi:MAG: hypothetical protein K8T89_02855, partial [Planctomycetes bacterium]|nr:hypothetical protein [Planctomycetota bacterium]